MASYEGSLVLNLLSAGTVGSVVDCPPSLAIADKEAISSSFRFDDSWTGSGASSCVFSSRFGRMTSLRR